MPGAIEYLRAVEGIVVRTGGHHIESLVSQRERGATCESAHFRGIEHLDGDARARGPLRVPKRRRG